MIAHYLLLENMYVENLPAVTNVLLGYLLIHFLL